MVLGVKHGPVFYQVIFVPATWKSFVPDRKLRDRKLSFPQFFINKGLVTPRCQGFPGLLFKPKTPQ